MSGTVDIPRWVEDLRPGTLERINELLYNGWQPSAVRRELELPESKRRSLEIHARKYRHRRVLAPLARLNELLAGGAEAIGPDYLKLLGMVIEQALTDETKRVRTAGVLGKFFGKIMEVGAKHQEAEERRERDAKRPAISDPQEVVRQLLEMYGVAPDSDGVAPGSDGVGSDVGGPSDG